MGPAVVDIGDIRADMIFGLRYAVYRSGSPFPQTVSFLSNFRHLSKYPVPTVSSCILLVVVLT